MQLRLFLALVFFFFVSGNPAAAAPIVSDQFFEFYTHEFPSGFRIDTSFVDSAAGPDGVLSGVTFDNRGILNSGGGQIAIALSTTVGGFIEPTQNGMNRVQFSPRSFDAFLSPVDVRYTTPLGELILLDTSRVVYEEGSIVIDLAGLSLAPNTSVGLQPIGTPEPSSALLVGLGLTALGWGRRN